VHQARLRFVVEKGNIELMARKIQEAVGKDWDWDLAVNFIIKNHTWEKRLEEYDRIIRQNCD